jgi:hypothetical protein
MHHAPHVPASHGGSDANAMQDENYASLCYALQKSQLYTDSDKKEGTDIRIYSTTYHLYLKFLIWVMRGHVLSDVGSSAQSHKLAKAKPG